MKNHAIKFLLVALPLAGLWWVISFHVTPISSMDTPVERLYFSINCCAVAAFFCLVMGVEAVARDRLFSPAVNPLAGFESKRLKVNKQYLQNTLEQTLLFSFAVLSFSSFAENGSDMRIIVASTIVWIISRFIFWISYHRDPLDRIYGLFGMIQTIVLLGYSVFTFIYRSLGATAAVLAVLAFVSIESVITYRASYQNKASHIPPTGT
jgi:hypothetical protein